MTFNGAKRVDYLLKSFSTADLSQIKEKIVVEDFCPNTKNHFDLCEIMEKYPDWKHIHLEKWGNSTGTAQKALENCETDWVFLLEDDQLSAGDPFKNIIRWLEFGEDIAEMTGAIYLTHYQAHPDLAKVGILPSDELEAREAFYNKPFDTWFTGEPIQLDARTTTMPSLGITAHGQGSCIRRSVWQEVGGYDLRWHAFDQILSYKIWLLTDKIIYTFPTDPFYHLGAMSQPKKFYPNAPYQGNRERCKEIFGAYPEEIESKIREKIVNKVAPIWQPKLENAYCDMGFKWRFV
jgi:hypothetical protein